MRKVFEHKEHCMSIKLIKPIKTTEDYRDTLTRVEQLMSSVKNTPAGDELDVLVTLLESYEKKHYPIDLPDPVSAIKFFMEQKGLTVKDLESIIGRSNRVYEILNHSRPLTLAMITRLYDVLDIPLECLIKKSPKFLDPRDIH